MNLKGTLKKKNPVNLVFLKIKFFLKIYKISKKINLNLLFKKNKTNLVVFLIKKNSLNFLLTISITSSTWRRNVADKNNNNRKLTRNDANSKNLKNKGAKLN